VSGSRLEDISLAFSSFSNTQIHPSTTPHSVVAALAARSLEVWVLTSRPIAIGEEMSMYLRCVIEKWGGSVTYGSREHDIADVLVALARQAQAGQVELRLYDDHRVVYIDQGRTFLDYLCVTDIEDMSATIAEAGLVS
jgi:hypothetical protein